MSDNKYLLPGYYKEGTEANTLLGSFENTVDLLKNYILSALSQTSAGTATWALDDWEKELGITPSIGASNDLRRAVIKAKLMRPPTMTPAQIKAIANCFVQDKDAYVIDPVAPYTFRIVIPSDVPWLSEMIQQIDEAKPSHLAMEIELDRTSTSNLYVASCLTEYGTSNFRNYIPSKYSSNIYVGAVMTASGQQTIRNHIKTDFKTTLAVGSALIETGTLIFPVREE